MANPTGVHFSNVCAEPSSEYITYDYWRLDGKPLLYSQIAAAVFTLYAFLGLPWNIAVVITILSKKLYLHPTIMLLLDLALTDILFELTTINIIVTGFAGEYIFGNSDQERCLTCRIGVLQVSLAMNGIFIIALMSLDRFLFIHKPFVYERKSNKLSTFVAIILTALLSLFLGLLSLVSKEKIQFREQFLMCLPDLASNWYSGTLIGAACLSLVAIISFNVLLICIVQKNIKAIYSVKQSKNNGVCDQQWRKRIKKEHNKRQIHLFRVFGLLILSNIISWMPKILLFLVIQFKEESEIPPEFFLVSHLLFFIQVVIHPMLETCFISDVREPLKRVITCNLLKHKQVLLDSAEETSCFQCCDHLQDSNIECVSWFHLLTTSLLPHLHSTNGTNRSSITQPSQEDNLHEQTMKL